MAKFGLIDGAVVSLNISVTEDGKKGGASSGLGIARTVEPTEVAATAQQGAVTPGAKSDWRTAAKTHVEERSVGTTEVAATAQQGIVLTPGAQSDWRAAAETVVEGSEDFQMGNACAEVAAAVAGGAAEDGPGATEAEAK